MLVSVSEVHSRLSRWLDKLSDGPIVITRHGEPVGVLIAPDEYDRLRKVQAYVELVRLSYELRDSGLTARDLYRSSLDELEKRQALGGAQGLSLPSDDAVQANTDLHETWLR